MWLSSAYQQINELVSSLRRAIGQWKYDLGQQETAEHFAWGETNTSAQAWISHEGPFHVEMKKEQTPFKIANEKISVGFQVQNVN